MTPIRQAKIRDVLAVALTMALAIVAQLSPWLAIGTGIAAVVFILLSFADSRGTVWALALVLAISPETFPPLGSLGTDASYKFLLTLLLIGLVFREGIRIPPAVALLVTLYLLAFAISLAGLPAGNLNLIILLKATVGFTYYWIGATIAWRTTPIDVVLRALRTAPAISVVASLFLGPLSGTNVVRVDYSGDIRLSGLLVPAHLAMLALAAVAASIAIMLLRPGRRSSVVWLMVNMLIVLLTLTRGAAVAALIVLFFAGLAASPKTLKRAAKSGVRTAIALTSMALIFLVPAFLARNQGNAYEGGFNTSGRTKSWDFYLSIAAESPWFGFGPGYSSVAVTERAPTGVQSIFEAPHNEYIHFYVDFGLPLTIGLFACLVALWISTGMRLPLPMAVWWAGFGLAVIVYAFVDNPLSTPQFSVPAALMISVLNTLHKERKLGPELVSTRRV